MHFNWLACWLLAPLVLSMVDSFETPQHPYNTRLKSTQHRLSCNFSTGSADSNITPLRQRPSVTIMSTGTTTSTSEVNNVVNTGSDARRTAGVGVGLPVQTTFRPGERITQKFTKDNPAAWCNYFDQICLPMTMILMLTRMLFLRLTIVMVCPCQKPSQDDMH